MTSGPSLTEFLTPYRLYADLEARLLLYGRPECGFALQMHGYGERVSGPGRASRCTTTTDAQMYDYSGGADARSRQARRFIITASAGPLLRRTRRYTITLGAQVCYYSGRRSITTAGM